MHGIKLSINQVGARGDLTLISITGYVDTTTCKELTRTIQNLIQQKQYQLIADLAGVSYISSAGWGVFMGEIKNILEKGGDLKIVQMSSEVFEVFEMLEFNRILNYYDTIEEAIDEFDIIRGIDITDSQVLKNNVSILNTGDAEGDEDSGPIRLGGRSNIKSYSVAIDSQEIPLVEKIKRIVVENPLGKTGHIQKKLNSEDFGYIKVGWFKIRSILKELNLDTKEKRYRFYRSR